MADEWFINLNAVKRVYQSVLTEDEEGEEIEIKMQGTPEFKEKLNDFVFEAISACVTRALEDGRRTLWPEDVPASEDHEQLDQA